MLDRSKGSFYKIKTVWISFLFNQKESKHYMFQKRPWQSHHKFHHTSTISFHFILKPRISREKIAKIKRKHTKMMKSIIFPVCIFQKSYIYRTSNTQTHKYGKNKNFCWTQRNWMEKCFFCFIIIIVWVLQIVWQTNIRLLSMNFCSKCT